MANKSFVISYAIKARDKFSDTSKRLNKTLQTTIKRLSKLQSKFKKIEQRASSLKKISGGFAGSTTRLVNATRTLANNSQGISRSLLSLSREFRSVSASTSRFSSQIRQDIGRIVAGIRALISASRRMRETMVANNRAIISSFQRLARSSANTGRRARLAGDRMSQAFNSRNRANINAATRDFSQLGDQINQANTRINTIRRNASAPISTNIQRPAATGVTGGQPVGPGLITRGAIATGTITLPAVLMAKSLKDAARDAQETNSKFDTVFRDISQQAEQSAQALANNFGLATSEAKTLASDTGDLLTGFGFTQESALDLSLQVQRLAVDLASFTNFAGGTKGASEAITKALFGEREALKSLGVVVTEELVKQKIAILQSKGAVFANINQAKAQATLAIAMEQSKNAIGDFARTSQDLANQERILAARTREAKESFGNILLPTMLKLTKVGVRLLESIQNLSPGLKDTIITIAGLAAATGPALVAVGGVAEGIRNIRGALRLFGVTGRIAMLPLLGGLALVAGAVTLVAANWDSFKGVLIGIRDVMAANLGPEIENISSKFIEMSKIINTNFNTDSGLFSFGDTAIQVFDTLSKTLAFLLRTLSGIGETFGQLAGAAATFDFGNFDFGAIKDSFLGEQSKIDLNAGQAKVQVGLNVGLADGLQQREAPQATGQGSILDQFNLGVSSGA